VAHILLGQFTPQTANSKQQTNNKTAGKSAKPAPPPTSATRLPLCITNDFINFQITESQRPAEHFVAFLWHWHSTTSQKKPK